MRFWTWPSIHSYKIPANHLHLWLFTLPDGGQKRWRQQLLAKLLTHYHPKPHQIATNPQGKPYLIDSALQFNVSHSQNLLLIGLQMHHPLGLDLEFIKTRDIHHFAERFWGKTWCQQQLFNYPQYLRLLGFYHAWTQTEAWVKYHGASVFRYPPFCPQIFPLPLQQNIGAIQLLTFMPQPKVLTSICTSDQVQSIQTFSIEIKDQDSMDRLLTQAHWYAR